MQHEFLGLLLSAKTLIRHHYASSSLHSCLKNSPPYSIFSRLNVFPMLLKTSSIPCHSHVHAKLLQSDFLWPYRLQPIRLFWPWDSSGTNTGVGCHAPLQGIFLTQGSNPGLLHYRQVLSHQEALSFPWGLGKKEFSFLIPSKAPPLPPNSLLSPQFQPVHCHLRAFAYALLFPSVALVWLVPSHPSGFTCSESACLTTSI